MASHHRKAAIWIVALALATLAWNIAADDESHLFFDPVDAVRGYALDVHVFAPSAHNCTLTVDPSITDKAGTSMPDRGWQVTADSMIFSLVVPLDVEGTLAATITCGQERNTTATKNIRIISDVDLFTSASISPYPADVGSSAVANFTLVNRGGHPAHDLQCTVTANSTFLTSCGKAAPSNSPTCTFEFLKPSESTTISLLFDKIEGDVCGNVTCKALNFPADTYNYTIMVKGDAKIEVVADTPATPVLAGSNITLVTTISNTGRAQADKLVCSLPVPTLTHFAFLRSSAPQCAPVPGPLNATQVDCTLGDFNVSESLAVSLDFHVSSSLAKDTPLNFTWTCHAEGLDIPFPPKQVLTGVQGNLGLTLPANSSIEPVGTTALLFRLTNDGPSDVTEGTCDFEVPGKEANVSSWSSPTAPNNFTCVRSGDEAAGIILNCAVHRLSPAGADFNLGLILAPNSSLTGFSVYGTCKSTQPAATPVPRAEYKISVAAKAPTPSPGPGNPVAPPPDNTLVVVVTVIVAVGLLIVIAIWWRKKQDRAGWDAAGPNPRSPSLNRYSEMELSIRSDD